MSVDLIICTAIEELPTWGTVKNHWKAALDIMSVTLLGDHPQIKARSNNYELHDEDKISIQESNSLQGMSRYYFDLNVKNNIFLSVANNSLTYLDEQAEVEDYGSALLKDLRDRIWKQWKKAGYHYSLSSYPSNRSEYEMEIMIALASALAKASNGYVIFAAVHIINLQKGIYTPEEFIEAKPKKYFQDEANE